MNFICNLYNYREQENRRRRLAEMEAQRRILKERATEREVSSIPVPKPAKSALNIFAAEMKKKWKVEQPSLTYAELNKLASSTWKALPDAERKVVYKWMNFNNMTVIDSRNGNDSLRKTNSVTKRK
jgi:hypothetical protein